MNTTTLLTILGEAVGCELEFNALGFCSLPVAGGMMMRVLERPEFETHLVCIEIGRVPMKSSQVVAGLVEEADTAGLGAAPGAVRVELMDAEGGVFDGDEPLHEDLLLVATCEAPIDGEPEVFEEMLARLLALAERWRVELPSLVEAGNSDKGNGNGSGPESGNSDGNPSHDQPPGDDDLVNRRYLHFNI